MMIMLIGKCLVVVKKNYAQLKKRCFIMKKANEILIDAAKLIDSRGQERDKDDGERSMERCVKSFNEMTGHELTETDGWKFMIFLKLARMEGGSFKFDDYEDAVSYSGLMAESALKENTEEDTTYDNVDMCVKCGSCCKCGCTNYITVKATDGGCPAEVETICSGVACRHTDHWAYGFFECEPKQNTEEV